LSNGPNHLTVQGELHLSVMKTSGPIVPSVSGLAFAVFQDEYNIRIRPLDKGEQSTVKNFFVAVVISMDGLWQQA